MYLIDGFIINNNSKSTKYITRVYSFLDTPMQKSDIFDL